MPILTQTGAFLQLSAKRHEGDLASGGALVDMFPDYDCTATEFDTAAWALYPSRSFLPRKVRVAIDFLREKLKTNPTTASLSCTPQLPSRAP